MGITYFGKSGKKKKGEEDEDEEKLLTIKKAIKEMKEGKVVGQRKGTKKPSPETFKKVTTVGPEYPKGTPFGKRLEATREAIKQNTQVPQIEGEQERIYAPGISKKTRRIQTATWGEIGDKTQQNMYQTYFEDRNTGEIYTPETVPTIPTYIPLSPDQKGIIQIPQIGTSKERGFVSSVVKGARDVLGNIVTKPLKWVGADVREAERVWGIEGESILNKDVGNFVLTVGSVGVAAFLLRGFAAGKVGAGAGVRGKTGAIIKKVSKKIIPSGWVKKAGAVAITGIGVGMMANWISSDNIISSAPFTARLIREAVEEGALSPAEGLQMMNEIEDVVDDAGSFVKGNSKLNPVAWGPLGKPYLINYEKTKNDLALHRTLLIQDAMKGGEANE